MDLIAVGYSLGLAASVLYLGGIGDRFGRNLVLILRMVLAGPGESDRGLRAERQHPRRCARGEVGRRPVSLAIESTNARYRRAVRARRHPTEHATITCICDREPAESRAVVIPPSPDEARYVFGLAHPWLAAAGAFVDSSAPTSVSGKPGLFTTGRRVR